VLCHQHVTVNVNCAVEPVAWCSQTAVCMPLLTAAIPIPFLFEVNDMYALLSDCSAVWARRYVGAWSAEK
jgi:hypothetical protein